MRNSFQVDGREKSVFVTCAALVPADVNFMRYEEHVRIKGRRIVMGGAVTVSYLFGEGDRKVLYLYESSHDGRPALAAAGVAYSPETPDEMLDELKKYTGLEETDDVPDKFIRRFETTLRNVTQRTIEMVEGRV